MKTAKEAYKPRFGRFWHLCDMATGPDDVRFQGDSVAKVFLSHRSQIFRAVRAAIER
jgi:hypothetical protein